MGLGWELKTLQMDTVKPQIIFRDGTLGSHGIYDPPPPPHESGHCVQTSTPVPGSCAPRAGLREPLSTADGHRFPLDEPGTQGRPVRRDLRVEVTERQGLECPLSQLKAPGRESPSSFKMLWLKLMLSS